MKKEEIETWKKHLSKIKPQIRYWSDVFLKSEAPEFYDFVMNSTPNIPHTLNKKLYASFAKRLKLIELNIPEGLVCNVCRNKFFPILDSYNTPDEEILNQVCSRSCNSKYLGDKKLEHMRDYIIEKGHDPYDWSSTSINEFFNNKMETLPKCKTCGNSLHGRFKSGFGTYCSVLCRSQDEDYKNKLSESVKSSEKFNEYNLELKKDGYENVKNHLLSTYEEFMNYELRDPVALHWKCPDCNWTWKARFHHYSKIPKCPSCTKSGPSSHEQFIQSVLDETNVYYRINDRKVLREGKNEFLELDFWIPDFNLAIEPGGLISHWYAERKYGKDYHYNKWKKCDDKDIRLMTFFSDETINKRPIIRSMILNALGVHERKLHGRKCIVEPISFKDASIFMNNNHIQGRPYGIRNPNCLCLKHGEEEVVSVIIFGDSGRERTIKRELHRFASLINISVSGGFSKLLKASGETNFVTFCDNRFFNGKSYEKSGFKYVETVGKDYYYFKQDYQKFNKATFMKHKQQKLKDHIYDSKLTEYQNMKNNGYKRIYDCGKKKYIFEVK